MITERAGSSLRLIMSFLQLHRPTNASLAVGTGCLAAIVTLALYRQRQNSRSTSPRDFYNNSSAKGSDVVAMYRETIPQNDFYIITGATSGLGREMALLLGSAGANVILAVRNTEQGELVKQEIIQRTNENGSTTYSTTRSIHVWHLDLSSLDSVRQFVINFKETFNDKQVLAGLVNNAGVYGVVGTTVDGFQTTWQTNILAPALLTELLLPNMTHDARIVNVSSELYKIVRHVGRHCPPTSSGASTYDYALSKACQVLHAHELTVRFAEEGSSKRAMAVEPGLVKTKIARHASRFAQWVNYQVLGPFLSKTVDQGCCTALYCLLAPDSDLRSGPPPCVYYANCAPKTVTNCCASFEEVNAQKKLFEKLWYE